MMTKSKLAFTFEEAAEATGVSSRTLRRFVERGDLAAKYINSKPVILAEELEAWLAALPSEAPGK